MSNRYTTKYTVCDKTKVLFGYLRYPTTTVTLLGLKDKQIHFKYSTEDVDKVTNNPKCQFREYKRKQLGNLQGHLEKAATLLTKAFSRHKNAMNE